MIRYHNRENINSREIKNVAGSMGVWPPLGLLYLGAALKEHEFEVELLDVQQRALDSAAARREIVRSAADLVGITCTTPEIRGVLEAARFAHETGAPVVLGGAHCDIFPEETLSHPEVDFVIRGDGEVPLVKLVKTMAGSNPDFSTVPGLVYRENGNIRKNDTYVETGLHQLSYPDWDLVPARAYSRADVLQPLATMISGRGCPYRCGFCYRGTAGSTVRLRDPVSVVDEMEYLGKTRGIREIVFCNDTLTCRRDHIMTISEELVKRDMGLVWQGATRVDTIDREMLSLMRRSGCKQLKFGVESGCGEILSLMKKGITKDQIRETFRWCKREKVRIGAYFILGYVDDTAKTLQETIDFAIEIDPDFVMFYAGVPLPETDFHTLAVERGKLDPEYWREYTLGRRDDKVPYMVLNLDRWVKRAFRQFYGRPAYLVKKMMSPGMWLSVFRKPGLVLRLFFPKNT